MPRQARDVDAYLAEVPAERRAARTLAAFGASVRDDVDLDALGERLTAVVDDTLPPAHSSLWLQQGKRE